MVVVENGMCTVGGRHSRTNLLLAQSKKSRSSFVSRVGGWVVICLETFRIVLYKNCEVCTHHLFALISLNQKNLKDVLDKKICVSYFFTKYFSPVYSNLCWKGLEEFICVSYKICYFDFS